MLINHKTEQEKKSREAAELRGQSKAYMGIGVAGAATWAAMELLPLMDTPISVATDNRLSSTRKVAILSALVGIGAAAFALERYLRADKAAEEKQLLQSASLPETSWVSRVGESRESLQHLSGNSR